MLIRLIFASYSKLLTGIALATMAAALAGCNETVAQKAEPIRPVLVASVHYEAETPERSFVGTIRPRIEADIGFRVAGKVAKRLVEVGQTVEVGQPLATLDEVDLKLQAEQAEAEFRAATGVLAQASAAETRAKELRAKGWTTDAQMDQAKASADEARARLNRAERSVELTRNSLSYATLVSDARGVVTASMIEPGVVVAAGQAAIRVARFAEKEAVVAIPETLLDRAKTGVATVSLWSEAGKTYTARLREIAPAADPATRTYLAKFSLPDANDAVSLGMTATLTLSDPATTRVARLPLSALFNDGRDPSLYVVNDKGEVTLKPVKVKAYDSKDVLITAGVEEGEKVVALGVQKIDPAQKVRVVSALTF
ncbi:putative component of multidrug efflux system; signal peptide [Bradyrhizobium sp. ORS 375]|uniref:efflux RND transporter periplasmic adaptor subunit n=1 Tax=Bradyrhizobium sp. (strain ORS 375) TaxID=566679 RepID=UPI0002405895|nr:efflux RND transporter periplasmic adaptor subunit [Bradyrhizobium sp. ORS 375]CCD94246.1 putative component of multidrug efflux system; signal peptide [Bradyrhizobium sp. ORS 375]